MNTIPTEEKTNNSNGSSISDCPHSKMQSNLDWQPSIGSILYILYFFPVIKRDIPDSAG